MTDETGTWGARVLLLVICIGICYAAAAIGSYFTGTSVTTWYVTLVKPPIAPPGGVIGAVWTVLYLLMGISLFLVASSDRHRPEVRQGLGLFALQLGLNMLWSFLFFGLRSPALALAGILVLWASIAATILQFLKVSRPAAYLLVPYILWVSFATVLTAWILVLNP
ncbi:MAG: tryptophan-rich sensory protein [Methanomicrobiales archaeon]|nr:tryptophan-rich sensory protein [Methanomicrobiales archaeon]